MRVGATNYRETLLSLLYPGNFTSLEALIPAVLTSEAFLGLTPEQRYRIVWRTDGGFGSDVNLDWLIKRAYHILAKGFSWKRASAWARRVRDWVEVRPGQRWLAWAPDQLDFGRSTQIVVARWLTPKGKLRHALYITTLLDLPLLTTISDLYDDRGGAEVEIGTDKVGLCIPGELVFEGEILTEVRLKQSHALAEPMLDILARLWDEDETLVSVVNFGTE